MPYGNRRGVKAYYKQRLLNPYIDNNGYLVVGLQVANHKVITKKVHQLVAAAFLPNPNKYQQINHKNEIRSDNRVENLEWCDAKYNSNYGTRKNV